MRIRYFAWLKQRVGLAEEELDPPPEVTTVGRLKAWLGERHPRFAEACAAPGVVRAAVDQEFADDDRPLRGAREVAFFPPVTGG
ncbi:MAG: molybdopterin converting factor subunit 1 [Geminicoccaceae bacterium]|jgi:molybdopterin synthase sulfur carrier subunit|nr:molybdopterin converting factor subunit 1 [Geminicoccaceae bacterium]